MSLLSCCLLHFRKQSIDKTCYYSSLKSNCGLLENKLSIFSIILSFTEQLGEMLACRFLANVCSHTLRCSIHEVSWDRALLANSAAAIQLIPYVQAQGLVHKLCSLLPFPPKQQIL